MAGECTAARQIRADCRCQIATSIREQVRTHGRTCNFCASVQITFPAGIREVMINPLPLKNPPRYGCMLSCLPVAASEAKYRARRRFIPTSANWEGGPAHRPASNCPLDSKHHNAARQDCRLEQNLIRPAIRPAGRHSYGTVWGPATASEMRRRLATLKQ